MLPLRYALAAAALVSASTAAMSAEAVWSPDLGDGTYKNPVLFADYSDPDAIRVADDYYLTSSSFHNAPGLPVLHSKDLVNWKIIGHALPRLVPDEHFSEPRHGAGIWAPSIRHHAGKFFIYYPDPDYGIYVTSAKNPAGPWSPPVLVKAGKGLIDPCPFWDDNGTAYLVHAWAKSRSGIANILTLHKMNEDGGKLLDEGAKIVDGSDYGWRTLEGPKVYKRDGWYYIFAPAGGVTEGFQGALRSKDIRGPYEARIVLAQGPTDVNGPHQGAWVDTPSGKQDWFLHFQDAGAYGRVVHLQPMVWKDGWPVIGADPDGDGVGQPVATYRKPDVSGRSAPAAPQASDEFDGGALGPGWQWQANPRAEWLSLSARQGWLTLRCVPTPANLRDAPNPLTQKLPAPEFRATTRVELHPSRPGDEAGLFLLGDSYAWIGLRKKTGDGNKTRVVLTVREDAVGGKGEIFVEGPEVDGAVWLRATVRRPSASSPPVCEFGYSSDGEKFERLGGRFTPTPGRWVGAKVGIFAGNQTETAGGKDATCGYADFEWFRLAPLTP